MSLPYSGAQAERTSLAWTRTGLALLVAVLIAVRLSAGRLGAVAIILAGAGGVAAVLALTLARRRYHKAHAAANDARLPALVAGVTFLLAAMEVGYAITG